MVHHQAVDAAKRLHRCFDQRAAIGGGGKILPDRPAQLRSAAVRSQRFCLRFGRAIAEGDPRARTPEQPDRRRSNAARAAGNQRNAALQRHRHAACHAATL